MGGREFGIWEPPLYFLDVQMNERMNEWSEGMTKEKMGLYNGWNWKREQSRATVKNPAKWKHKRPIVGYTRLFKGWTNLRHPVQDTGHFSHPIVNLSPSTTGVNVSQKRGEHREVCWEAVVNILLFHWQVLGWYDAIGGHLKRSSKKWSVQPAANH